MNYKLPDGATSVEFAPGYCVTRSGLVYSCINLGNSPKPNGKWRLLSGSCHPVSGHNMVGVGGKKWYRGRLILTVFVGPCPPGMECCHCDGNPKNDDIGNLRWDTRSENIKDMFRHGTDKTRGTKSHFAKLSEQDVIEIRRLCESGVRQLELSNKFGVSRECISVIINGKSWKHIPISRASNKGSHKFSEQERQQIFSEYLSGVGPKALSVKYNIDPSYLYWLKNKRKSAPQKTSDDPCTNSAR